LEELKKDKVDAVLIDLRNNGGGSLDEAVELTGLFTGEGPVVQERNSQGNVRIDSSHNTTRAWDGPLGVLINRASASASEIFAAAIQDYGRGVIIGEPSFGKGTVQTLINFDQMAHSDKPKLGELKMTVAQFFRVNGGTTQLRGVMPDISFPTVSDIEKFGESSYDNALPWTQIKAASYVPATDVAGWLPSLQSRHTARVAKDKDFQYLLEDVAEINAQRKKRAISLNEVDRRKERNLQESRLTLRTDSSDVEGGGKRSIKGKSAAMKRLALQDLGLQAGERKLSDELADEKAQKDAKDVWLIEATHILRCCAHVKHEARVVSAGWLDRDDRSMRFGIFWCCSMIPQQRNASAGAAFAVVATRHHYITNTSRNVTTRSPAGRNRRHPAR
jgi:carboxyl-terminal processing protease